MGGMEDKQVDKLASLAPAANHAVDREESGRSFDASCLTGRVGQRSDASFRAAL